MGDAWIIDAVRTPRGRGKKETGGLSGVHPQELLATCLNGLQHRNGFDPKDVEDVVAGCVTAVGEQGGCVARMSVLAAGWDPEAATGVTINRYCGSGQQAVNFAAMGVMAGQQDLVIGGGVESMSKHPMGADKSGIDGHNSHLRELHPLVPQGISADLIAAREGFSREDVDQYALESQQRAGKAQREGRYDKSILPVADNSGAPILDRDEHVRPETTLEGLAKLPASFEGVGGYVQKGDARTFIEKANSRYPDANIEHVHTAGNSSGIVDGAGAVLIASPGYAQANDLKPRARIVSMATAGDEPIIMLTAPTPASENALKKAGMTIGDIDVMEINEAFAVVPMKTMRDLKIDHEKVNINGGAIALGHPLGATGAMLLGTALDELERQDKSTALVTMCIGNGMGVASIIERV